jgi:hypothetical protein
VEIHCALGQFSFREDIIEPDLMVRQPGELVCGSIQNLLAGGVRSLVS